MTRAVQRLEFDGVLAMLAERLPWSLGAARISGLAPLADFSAAVRAQAETRDWLDAFARGLALPAGGYDGDVACLLRLLSSNDSMDVPDFLDARLLLTLAVGARQKLKAVAPIVGATNAAYQRLADFAPLLKRLEEVFDPDGRIKDGASPDLRRIRKDRRVAEKSLQSAFGKFVLTEKHSLQDAVVTMRAGRYVVPVRSDRMEPTRFIVHDTSDSGATMFAEPVELLPFNNERQKLMAAELQEIARLLSELARALRERAMDISDACEVLSDLSYYRAVFRLAGDLDAKLPKLAASGGFRLLRARHPFLIPRAVPCDIGLSREYSLIIISGPNAGGKTVVLKTVGLLTLMASCGLPIPADPDSEILVPAEVFVILGDEQSLEADLSTFTARLLPLKEAIDTLARQGAPIDRLLLLLDELGAGTDPEEGAAFAESVIRFLGERKAFALISTHFQRLKVLAYELPGIQNAALLFDETNFTPTYQLRVGSPGPSLGLKAARFMGIPDGILKAAEALVSGRQTAAEQLLTRAHQEWLTATQLKADAEKLWREADALKTALDAREGALEKEGREKARQLYRDAEAFVKQAKHHCESIIKGLEGEVKLSENVRRQKEEIWRLFREASARQAGPEEGVEGGIPGQPVWRRGDAAWLPTFRQKVEVVEPADRQGVVTVRSGVMTLRVLADELMLPAPEGEKPPPAPDTALTRAQKRGAPDSRPPGADTVIPGMELNLTGMTSDAAVHEVDLALNRAFSRSIRAVRIIHGKGTGKLRSSVREFLSQSPIVKSFAPGDPRGGGDGVTIATIEEAE